MNRQYNAERAPEFVHNKEDMAPVLLDEEDVPLEIFVPEGSTGDFGSAGYKGVLKGGKALLTKFLANRTVNKKHMPLRMSEENREILTSDPFLDHFAVFCTVAVHGPTKKLYSHIHCSISAPSHVMTTRSLKC